MPAQYRKEDPRDHLPGDPPGSKKMMKQKIKGMSPAIAGEVCSKVSTADLNKVYEMFEGTYKTIWRSCVPYPLLNDYWKKNHKKETSPILHYVISVYAMDQILNNLELKDNFPAEKIKMIRANLHEGGYTRKYYSMVGGRS